MMCFHWGSLTERRASLSTLEWLERGAIPFRWCSQFWTIKVDLPRTTLSTGGIVVISLLL